MSISGISAAMGSLAQPSASQTMATQASAPPPAPTASTAPATHHDRHHGGDVAPAATTGSAPTSGGVNTVA
jgi:hypothetical protein